MFTIFFELVARSYSIGSKVRLTFLSAKGLLKSLIIVLATRAYSVGS